jgi:hypothetical protein
MKWALALPLIALALPTCSDAPGQWASIVYPDGSDRGRFETTYRFKSQAMCRQAAGERIAALPDPTKAAYECVKTTTVTVY